MAGIKPVEFLENLPNDELRLLCIREDWFTGGDIKQYEKLFQMNSNNLSARDLALVIWLCSHQEFDEILKKLTAAMREWAKLVRGV